METQERRVRFAPSPTGYLHIGGARTAVFNWIFARSRGGKFLLRIEDTDRKRSTQEFLDSILQSLRWLGLNWDEEPFIQSMNSERHRSAVEELLRRGAAYKCFCTKEILERKRQKNGRRERMYRYDGTCRNLTEDEAAAHEEAGEPFVVRCRIPEGETVVDDLIHGRTVFNNREIEDFVIQRQDMSPTYMLAVVVDDHAMNITHVIRGDDHLSNTPKQIILYNALGWRVPQFGHMPMILGPDKSRLSKRHGAVSVEAYRERGYLPEAVRNFLILLGWSPGEDREIISIDEVVRLFRIEDSNKKSAVFDEQKLLWLNRKYLSEMPGRALAERLLPYIARDKELDRLVGEKGEKYLLTVIGLVKNRLKLLPEFITHCGYFYRDPVTYEPAAVKKHWNDPAVRERLARVRLCILNCGDYTLDGIEADMRTLADEMGIPAAQLIHPTRVALTGLGGSPGLFEVLYVLGRETVARRLENAVSFLGGVF